MKYSFDNACLVIELDNRIDSENAVKIEAETFKLLEKHQGDYVLDARNLEYIASAGLRFLLNLIKKSRPPKAVLNTTLEVYEILEATGFTNLLSVKRKLRDLNIDSFPEIGHGAIGKVYRIDPDTIVKVYNRDVRLESIEMEQQRAKQAFLEGIPTAITFEIVRVGEQYGAVFELLKAENCNDMIIRAPERFDEIIHDYVNLMKTVHRVIVRPGELPDNRNVYQSYLDQLSMIIPQSLKDGIKDMICSMPEDLHVIHGDFHMKNILFSKGEPMLIDMETLSTGNPIFDFAGLYVTYKAYNEDEPENTMSFLGLDRQTCDNLFYQVLKLYLGTDDETEVTQAEDKIRIVGYIRFLYLLNILNIGNSDLKDIRNRHCIEHIRELLERVKRLDI